jgi:hypothetical protein
MSLTSPSITFFADFGLNESLVPVFDLADARQTR